MYRPRFQEALHSPGGSSSCLCAWTDPASLWEDTDARVKAGPWGMKKAVFWRFQTQRKMDVLSAFLLHSLFHRAAELSL